MPGMTESDRLTSITLAAQLVGIPERTLRRWIARGQLSATSGPRGRLVDLERVQQLAPSVGISPPVAENDRPDSATAANVRSGERVAEDDRTGLPEWPFVSGAEVVALIERQQQTIMELSGRLGFYQARIQELERRVLELEAPKEASAEMSNQPAQGRGDQDLTRQAVSTEPKEQPQAEAASAPSMTSTTDSQEISSGGAFKRFWRWLTQPG